MWIELIVVVLTVSLCCRVIMFVFKKIKVEVRMKARGTPSFICIKVGGYV